MRRLIRAFGALMLLCTAGGVLAQFPDRPVRIVVPYGPGGPTDLTARVLAQGLTDVWGKQVLVENRPGANGHIGTEAVIKSAPDGHMLVVVPTGPLAINQFLYKKMPFDPERDLTPISQLVAGPLLMYVAPQLPVADVAQFVRYAKENGNRLNFSSTGGGTLPHLLGEMFKAQAGIDMVHVPYKGVPQAMAAVMTGEVSVMFDTANSLTHANAGKVRALAVAGKKRYDKAPNVPTMAEAGYPGMDVTAWFGLLGPARMPAELASRISSDARKVLLNPDAKAKLGGIHMEPIASTPEGFSETIHAERKKWKAVVERAGIVPE